ncbi:MAG: 3-deoxy-manno-octulosonate cytidylyltransferase [Candidatus Neomarinimicrobiota bacterium]
MVIGVIPARLESTRFSRKILFPIRNKPMVMHVYERVLKAKKINRLIIAVDSLETVNALKDYDVEVIMTSSKHRSGTDRIAEVVAEINADIIINIQGDEPMLEPGMIDDLVSVFDDKTVKIATLASTVITENDLRNSNSVKVIVDSNQNAEGFYRNITDYSKKYYRHVGIYGYRKDVLETFTKLERSKNEKALHLEQLRALDNGIPIRVVMCDFPYSGIDTLEDLEQLNL